MIPAILFRAVSSRPQAEADKVSLTEQSRVLLSVAEREGWTVVDTITVPGFSRDYHTYREFAEAAAAAGHPDPLRMFDHWNNRDFKVFLVWDGSRFGRKASIFSEVVGRTIDAGAVLYVHTGGGIVDARNAGMFSAMGGYAAESEIKKFRERRTVGMVARAERGLHTGSAMPFFHKYEYDSKGRPVRMVVDRAKYQRMIDDLYDLFVNEKTAYDFLELTMFERGHARPDGTPFWLHNFFRVIHTPAFWGHTGTNYRNLNTVGNYANRLWMLEPGHPAPPETKIFYNTCEPVYHGEQHEQFKNEFKRRLIMRGRRYSYRTHAFSGFIICADCGSPMRYNAPTSSRTKWRGYYCSARSVEKRLNKPGISRCEQSRGLQWDTIVDYVDNLLKRMVDSAEPETLLPQSAPAPDRTEGLKNEIALVDKRIGTLTARLADVPDAALPDAYQTLEQLGTQRDNLRRQLVSAELAAAERQQRTAEVRAVVQEIAAMTLTLFWAQDEPAIHQMLHRLFGPVRMVADSGEVIALRYVDS